MTKSSSGAGSSHSTDPKNKGPSPPICPEEVKKKIDAINQLFDSIVEDLDVADDSVKKIDEKKEELAGIIMKMNEKIRVLETIATPIKAKSTVIAEKSVNLETKYTSLVNASSATLKKIQTIVSDLGSKFEAKEGTYNTMLDDIVEKVEAVENLEVKAEGMIQIKVNPFGARINPH